MADKKAVASKPKSNSDWEKIKQEAEKGLNVTKDSIGEIGEDLKRSAETFGQDVKKFADGLITDSDEQTTKSGGKAGQSVKTGAKNAKTADKNVLVEFKDNLTTGSSRKKTQAWVILIGLLIIICGILVAIFS